MISDKNQVVHPKNSGQIYIFAVLLVHHQFSLANPGEQLKTQTYSDGSRTFSLGKRVVASSILLSNRGMKFKRHHAYHCLTGRLLLHWVCHDSNVLICAGFFFFPVNPCEDDPTGTGTTPCQNGGRCTGFSAQEEVSVAYYVCTCTAGWTGTNCEVPVGGQIPNPTQVKL